ncbi:hypothetical protein CFIMG_008257RA00001 [Ceratocystis fimbriata CBS 114723]|uniref:C2H2-type domain-containing protein n=1 Tax=Ceratocystis fimbriata CBS 114723 TaxID=1035309 RepID=A0A2C5X5V1_9PEZI|nr:hypothetical protein CFIMG_008257RA00001 [Ceratocystis fimbriata CBS 114723]
MATKHGAGAFNLGVSLSMRHTRKKPRSDGLTMFRQVDLEQHLARCHPFLCPRCNEPFESTIIRDRHVHNEPHCLPQEAYHDDASIEKALKKKFKEHQKGGDQASKIANLYKRLFDDIPKGRMQFPFPPILLPLYYAITTVVMLLLWASLLGLNRKLSIGLAPKFIYDLLMAFTSLDLMSVEPFIELSIKLANAYSSEKGLKISMEEMIRQLCCIEGISFEEATAHGTLPSDFEKMGGDLSSRVRKVLDDNPHQLALISRYLKTILQDKNDMIDQTHNPQGDPSEFQQHIWDQCHLETLYTRDVITASTSEYRPMQPNGDYSQSIEMGMNAGLPHEAFLLTTNYNGSFYGTQQTIQHNNNGLCNTSHYAPEQESLMVTQPLPSSLAPSLFWDSNGDTDNSGLMSTHHFSFDQLARPGLSGIACQESSYADALLYPPHVVPPDGYSVDCDGQDTHVTDSAQMWT